MIYLKYMVNGELKQESSEKTSKSVKFWSEIFLYFFIFQMNRILKSNQNE